MSSAYEPVEITDAAPRMSLTSVASDDEPPQHLYGVAGLGIYDGPGRTRTSDHTGSQKQTHHSLRIVAMESVFAARRAGSNACPARASTTATGLARDIDGRYRPSIYSDRTPCPSPPRLAPSEFQILLALLDGPMNGAAIKDEVARRTPAVRARARTLYTSIKRMLDDALIGERGPGATQRERVYRIRHAGARPPSPRRSGSSASSRMRGPSG